MTTGQPPQFDANGIRTLLATNSRNGRGAVEALYDIGMQFVDAYEESLANNAAKEERITELEAECERLREQMSKREVRKAKNGKTEEPAPVEEPVES